MFHNLLSFGDIIELNLVCNPSKIRNEIKAFKWMPFIQTVRNAGVNRYGISITSLDGEMSGVPDLASIYEYNEENNTRLSELSFNTLTDFYWQSGETRKLIDPYKKWIGRTHFVNVRRGGFFPPHRDYKRIQNATTFRILVPIHHCNPNHMYFIYEGVPVNFTHGSAYFINTNKVHSIFSFSDQCSMLVMNIEITPESLEQVTLHFKYI